MRASIGDYWVSRIIGVSPNVRIDIDAPLNYATFDHIWWTLESLTLLKTNFTDHKSPAVRQNLSTLNNTTVWNDAA